MAGPQAFLIGAAKAGTTTLATALAHHPGIHVNAGDGRGSEISWFDGGNRRRDRDWYEAHFDRAGPHQVRVDYSTSYSRYPRRDTAPKIASYAPDARIVYQVREPIERMRSNWRMRVREGNERRPFAEAVVESDYLDLSSYGTQLGRYLEHFPATAVHVTTLDAMSADVGAVVLEIADFLGAPGEPDDPIDEAPRNTRRDRRTPDRIRAIASTSVGGRLRAALPSAVIRRVRTLATTPVAYPDDHLPEDLLADLRAHLAEDMRALRPFLSPGWDAWGLLSGG